MQWSRDPHGGFTTNPHPKNPVISGGTYGFEHVNVGDQRRDPNSLMNWMERMIRTRKETPEIGWGDFISIPTRRRDVLILRYTWQDNAVVVIHSFSADPIELRFRSGPKDAKDQADTLLTNVLSSDHSRAEPDGRHCIILEPYGYRWFRVGGLDDLLRRSNT
jgi:maltose alpha-D-glucosyltransferase/alpha-amylase